MIVPHQSRTAVIAAVALATALSACAGARADSGAVMSMGSEDAHAGHMDPPDPIEGAREVAVTAKAFSFEPAAMTVQAGQPVNIALTATDMLHDFTVEGQDFHLMSNPGTPATGGMSIAEPGTYTVYCTVPGHRDAGMELTLTVE